MTPASFEDFVFFLSTAQEGIYRFIGEGQRPTPESDCDPGVPPGRYLVRDGQLYLVERVDSTNDAGDALVSSSGQATPIAQPAL